MDLSSPEHDSCFDVTLGESVNRRFGERIRALRLAKGWSQEDLAERAGMDRTYVGGIERGRRNPTLKNVAALARALECHLNELFEFPGEEHGSP